MCRQKYADKSGTLIQWRSVPLLMFVSYLRNFYSPTDGLLFRVIPAVVFHCGGFVPRKEFNVKMSGCSF
ncbi:hypothetical protein HNQ38_001618 [Desulfovibrio intestinalis]|uniref:Uncharacterized protein n=1 Tax=Desulfovibrio intestinalis TaxID=58621 RepID=A0A7W8C1F3_9BACT|nr:hypothetical protein [Desulfovibrio intestinalis]